MKDDEMRVRALCRQIADAFAGVSRDGGISLHEADIIDAAGSLDECAAARKKDVDTIWNEVPSPDIERYYSVLSFLDPIGFRYYIAAYMTWSLQNYRHSNSLSSDMTIYALNLEENADLRAYKIQQFSLLNGEQKNAARAFLTYMADESDDLADSLVASEALGKYWNQFAI